MVAQGDFPRSSDRDDFRTLGARLRRLIRRTGLTHSEKPEVVGQIMSTDISAALVQSRLSEGAGGVSGAPVPARPIATPVRSH